MDTNRKHAEFEAEGPDGVTFRFIAPADSTEEQLKRYAFIEYQERMKSATPKEPPQQQAQKMTPPLPPLPQETPPEQKETPAQFEDRLKNIAQAQDINQAQLFGGAAGAGLSAGRIGADLAGGFAQNIGRQAEIGRMSAQGGGTGGEKWARNWAGQERPGIGGVPEASAAYQRSKGQGPVSGRMSKMWGPAGPNEPAALIDRLMARTAPVRPSALDQVTGIFRSMLGPVSRYGLPPLALAGAAGEGVRAKQMLDADKPDLVGAGLSGVSALSGLASLSPAMAPVAVPIGLGAGAMQYLRSRLAQNAPVSAEEESAAARPAFGVYPGMGRRP